MKLSIDTTNSNNTNRNHTLKSTHIVNDNGSEPGRSPYLNADFDREAHLISTARRLYAPGEVVELRAFKSPKVSSGYFDNPEALAKAALMLDEQGFQVYVTLNPVKQVLLARAQNEVIQSPLSATSDTDVLFRRWLMLDFDPVRCSGVSADEQEKAVAKERSVEVESFLQQQGWPEPLVADSGNGFNLLYRIDLPNDDGSRDLVKGVLETLSFKFDDDLVEIDTSVFNAARLCKLYGVTARKGDATADRPHRISKVVEIPSDLLISSEGGAA
jgi:hypothetical protein